MGTPWPDRRRHGEAERAPHSHCTGVRSRRGSGQENGAAVRRDSASCAALSICFLLTGGTVPALQTAGHRGYLGEDCKGTVAKGLSSHSPSPTHQPPRGVDLSQDPATAGNARSVVTVTVRAGGGLAGAKAHLQGPPHSVPALACKSCLPEVGIEHLLYGK